MAGSAPGAVGLVSARDNQRQRLYNAETALAGSAHGRRMETVPELQAYVDAIMASRWFKARWGAWGGIRVKDGRGRRSACAMGQHEVRMPCWSRNEMVLLHEVAHCLAPVMKANHGPEYAGIFLALVRQYMGPAAAVSLRASFREHRVKVAASAVPAARYRVESKTARERAVRVAASRPPQPHGSHGRRRRHPTCCP